MKRGLIGTTAAAIIALGVLGYIWRQSRRKDEEEALAAERKLLFSQQTQTVEITQETLPPSASQATAAATPTASPKSEADESSKLCRQTSKVSTTVSDNPTNFLPSREEASPVVAVAPQLVRPHDVYILFGTQSGKSEYVAMDIRQHLQTAHKFNDVVVADIEYYRHYPPHPGSFFVFVIATYGDGDPSESAEQFWREMKSKALNESGIWQGIPVCVIGLGNKSYNNFCGFAVKLSKKFKTIRASRVCPLLKITDDQDIDLQLEDWLHSSFDPAVSELCSRPHTLIDVRPIARAPPSATSGDFVLFGPADVVPEEIGVTVSPCSSVVKPIFNSAPANFRITRCRPLGTVSLSERRMYLVDVEQLDAGIHLPNLFAGGTFSFFPSQLPADAIFLIGLFEHEGVSLISLQQHRLYFKTESAPVPNGTTLEELVTVLSNFSLTPSAKWVRSFLLPQLAPSHPLQSVFCEGPEGDMRYRTIVKAPPLTLRELLSYAHALEPFRLSLGFLLDNIARVAPRQYTIASAVDQGRFSLLVTETFTHRAHHPRLTGLCSAMLNRISTAPVQVPMPIRGLPATAIFQPDTWSCGGMWIVNGSGVAAVMAFLDQRRKVWSRQAPRVVPETLLFYGSRTAEEKDFAAHEAIRSAIREGWLTDAFFAFSRSPSGRQIATYNKQGELTYFQLPPESNRQDRLYVHALIMARREDVRRAIKTQPDSNICICGSLAMKGTVWGALVGVFEQEGIEYLSNLIAEQRVLAECW